MGLSLVLEKKLTILIPMSGLGTRFQSDGYEVPKPLIEVSGKAMVIQAVKSLPKADRYVFVCRKEHIEENRIDELLQSHFINTHIKSIDYLTQGQASTCLLAEDMIDPQSQLLVSCCDNSMVWNKNKFDILVEDENIDAIIWTFRNHVTVNRNPQMYGWVKVAEKNKAKNISCKTPISVNPAQDHAISGTFWFRQSKDFFLHTKSMIKKNRRINNEFYVDQLLNEYIENNRNVKIFEIDKYVCWGTPNDLRIFEYWQNFFKEES